MNATIPAISTSIIATVKRDQSAAPERKSLQAESKVAGFSVEAPASTSTTATAPQATSAYKLADTMAPTMAAESYGNFTPELAANTGKQANRLYAAASQAYANAQNYQSYTNALKAVGFSFAV